ncbi:hypothetical protein LPJ64_001841 [Coemansia asiatica]|uniref:Ribosomal silencing factor RsfS n=1 Tax=Coemansia asiatica TaxID=1052880 RepID=A0A9W8CL42_9FUNG|nr:hypothetical protein LPJ64_001841 [Coemansia asiatica]KAJ2887546.1 hypothetical protein FB639_001236 [Coemansia asiatica]
MSAIVRLAHKMPAATYQRRVSLAQSMTQTRAQFGTAAAVQRLSSDRKLDREAERQKAEDDLREEVAEHQRRSEENGDELAPEVERLDPESVPGLYPEFESEEMPETGEREIEGDDSWYVDSSLETTEGGESQPLWKRRAAANLGRPSFDVSEFASGSLFDLCQAVLAVDTEVKVLDVADRCEWTARMVIAEAKSTRHMRAMLESLLKAIKERNRAKGQSVGINVDGRESDDWIVVDLGSFVVHIMTPEAMKTYDLEKLWSTPADADIQAGK